MNKALALLLGLAIASVPPHLLAQAKKEKDDLFNGPKVLHLKIELPPQSLETLQKDPKKYAKATLREGDKTYADVGLRFKGSGAFQPLDKKPNLAVKIDEFTEEARFHGQSRFFLNSARKDPTYLADYVAGELFRKANVPSPKTAFARVEINGRDLGLYVLGQAVNKDFLGEYFEKTKGNLYEGDNTDVNDRMERDSGTGPNEQKDLKALAAAAKEGDVNQRLKKLETVLDIPRFINFLAMEVLLWREDGYTFKRNNYRLFNDPATSRFVVIPHNSDEILSKPTGSIQPESQGLLAKAVLDTPDGQKRYKEALLKFSNEHFKPAQLQSRIKEAADKIRPVVARNPEEGKTFEAAVAKLTQSIEQRAKSVSDQLK